jgi:hypothetical protein
MRPDATRPGLVPRLLSNVAKAFVNDGALPDSRWIAAGKQWP